MKQLALDSVLQRIFAPVSFPRGGYEQWQSAPQQCQHWRRVYELLQRLAPTPQAVKTSSLSWPHIWLPVRRESWGEVKAWYTEDDEDEIESPEELEENWQLEYPYETDWLRAACEVCDGTLSCALLPKECCLLLKLDQDMVRGLRDFQDEEVWQGFEAYTDWVTTTLEAQLNRLLEDPHAYHATLEQRLPKRERFGKLRRRDFWNGAPDAEHFLRNELTPEEVTTFSALAGQLRADVPLRDLTLNDFLRFCTLCYEGAGYELTGLTAREQYLAKADGRHAGLLDIAPDSPHALADTGLSQATGAGTRGRLSAGAIPPISRCFSVPVREAIRFFSPARPAAARQKRSTWLWPCGVTASPLGSIKPHTSNAWRLGKIG